MINRIPVADISPVVYFGGEFLPVKAIAGEVIPVTATIFREGHDLLGAQVILFDAQGREVQRNICARNIVQFEALWLHAAEISHAATQPTGNPLGKKARGAVFALLGTGRHVLHDTTRGVI